MYKPHIIIIIIIVVNFIIVICLYNVMYFQYTSLSIHLYKELSINHYSDVIMSAMASQITGVSIVCATVCSGANQGKYQCSTSLASVRGSHRWPVDSPHKGPVTWKIFPFDDVIMILWNIIIFKWISNKKQWCVSNTGYTNIWMQNDLSC